jgi:hypothetical protein
MPPEPDSLPFVDEHGVEITALLGCEPSAPSLYRAGVIGTRTHVLVTMRLLNAVKQRAERA